MPNQLLTNLRAKYPGSYDDMSDGELAQKLIAKYPGAYDADLQDVLAPTQITPEPVKPTTYEEALPNEIAVVRSMRKQERSTLPWPLSIGQTTWHGVGQGATELGQFLGVLNQKRETEDKIIRRTAEENLSKRGITPTPAEIPRETFLSQGRSGVEKFLAEDMLRYSDVAGEVLQTALKELTFVPMVKRLWSDPDYAFEHPVEVGTTLAAGAGPLVRALKSVGKISKAATVVSELPKTPLLTWTEKPIPPLPKIEVIPSGPVIQLGTGQKEVSRIISPGTIESKALPSQLPEELYRHGTLPDWKEISKVRVSQRLGEALPVEYDKRFVSALDRIYDATGTVPKRLLMEGARGEAIEIAAGISPDQLDWMRYLKRKGGYSSNLLEMLDKPELFKNVTKAQRKAMVQQARQLPLATGFKRADIFEDVSTKFRPAGETLHPGRDWVELSDDPVGVTPEHLKYITDPNDVLAERRAMETVKTLHDEEQRILDIINRKPTPGVTKYPPLYVEVTQEAKRTNRSIKSILSGMEESAISGVPKSELGVLTDTAIIENPVYAGFKKYGLFMSRTAKKVSQQGPAGEKTSALLQHLYDTEHQLLNRWTMSLDKIEKGLSAAEVRQLREVSAGRLAPAKEGLAKRAIAMRALLDEVANRVEAVNGYNASRGISGIKSGRLENYFPQAINFEFLQNPRSVQKIAEALEKNGYSSGTSAFENANKIRKFFLDVVDDTVDEAELGKVYDPFIKFDNISLVKKSGNLEFKRNLHDPEVIKILQNVGVMDNDPSRLMRRYLRSAAHRIESTRVFGGENEVFKELLGQIKQGRFGDVLVKQIYRKNVIGLDITQESRMMNRALQTIMTPVQMAVLGATAISQVPTLITGFSTLSIKQMGMVIRNLRKWKSATEYAKDIGAITNITQGITDDISNLTRQGYDKYLEKLHGVREKFYTGIQARRIDSWSRVIDSQIGKQLIQDDFALLATAKRTNNMNRVSRVSENRIKDILPEYQTALSRGRLTESEINLAAKRYSDAMAGNASYLQLPHWVNNPYGNVATTVKKTAIQNTGAQIDFYFKPAWKYIATNRKEGTLAPLFKGLALAGIGGAPVMVVKNALYDRDNPKSLQMWVLESIMNGYGGALWSEMATRAIRYPQSTPESIFVPVPVTTIWNAVQGKLPPTGKIISNVGKKLFE